MPILKVKRRHEKRCLWDVSIRGDNAKGQPFRETSFYIVARGFEDAVSRALEYSGLHNVEYMQLTRKSNVRGLQ
jgi:hypothetical protein